MATNIQLTTKQESIERRRRAWKLRIKGWEQDDIAKKLGVSQAAVSKMLKKAGDYYHSHYLKSVIKVKDEQVAQHYHIYAQAMTAWRKSRSQLKTNTIKQGVTKDKKGNLVKSAGAQVINQTKDQHGDHQYLMVALKALAEVRKLIGLDNPSKFSITDPDGKPIDLTTPSLEKQIDDLTALLFGKSVTETAGGDLPESGGDPA